MALMPPSSPTLSAQRLITIMLQQAVSTLGSDPPIDVAAALRRLVIACVALPPDEMAHWLETERRAASPLFMTAGEPVNAVQFAVGQFWQQTTIGGIPRLELPVFETIQLRPASGHTAVEIWKEPTGSSTPVNTALETRTFPGNINGALIDLLVRRCQVGT